MKLENRFVRAGRLGGIATAKKLRAAKRKKVRVVRKSKKR